ncbi:MAG: GGDEF domain-containing protein [Lawsonibacter sp.]|nr:GGDEF domain-containing protein [Lawsonibacter sp.]
MELVATASVNLTAIVFLAIVLQIARFHLDGKDKFNQLFFCACTLTLIALFLEVICRVLEGQLYICADWVLRVLLALLDSLPSILAYFWFLIIKALTGDHSEESGAVRPVYLIAVVVAGLLLFLSVFFGLLYSIDGASYVHGSLYIIPIIVASGYFLASLFVLFRCRSCLRGEEFKILCLLCLLPIAGGLLQAFLHRTYFMWSFTADSLIIFYVYLQERMIQVDSLTGAWTRRSFSQYLCQVERKHRGRSLGVLFLDLDDFKSINDQYGHVEGDTALRTFSDILKRQLGKEDVLARVGGDEFVILASVYGSEGLHTIKRNIESALKNFNCTSGKSYSLNCSIGMELYDHTGDLDSTMADVDHLMYKQKRTKKDAEQTGQ